MWFVNFDKTFSRVGRLWINGIRAAVLKDEKEAKLILKRKLSSEQIIEV